MNTQIINKVLDWLVKIAGMVICAPVTWLVAGDLFTDVHSTVLRFAIQLAAVMLVEGVLLSNWLRLELDRNAAPEIKARYAITALIMYGGLWILAWQHGEGAAGIVFRTALGLALAGSGWDTYVTTFQKLTARADKDVQVSRRVRRESRNLAQLEALTERRVASDITLAQLTSTRQLQLRRVELESGRQLHDLEVSYSKPNQAPEQPSTTVTFETRRESLNTHRKAGKAARLDDLVEVLRDNPNGSLRQLGRRIGGASPETVRRYLDQLEAEGRIHRNGTIEVIDEGTK